MKREILDEILRAKTGHKRWLAYAKAIHMGIPVDKKAIPLIETDCHFGQWYYGKAQVFSNLESFKAIEEPHTMLHQIYMHMYKLRKAPLETGFFTSKKSAKKKRQEELDKYMEQLIHVSSLLMESLDQFEKDIRNMSETELLSYN